jgi:hypothetical protein
MLTLADGRARGKVLFRFLRDMGNWGSRVAVNHLSLTGEVRFLDHALGVVENSLDVASSDRTQPPITSLRAYGGIGRHARLRAL